MNIIRNMTLTFHLHCRHQNSKTFSGLLVSCKDQCSVTSSRKPSAMAHPVIIEGLLDLTLKIVSLWNIHSHSFPSLYVTYDLLFHSKNHLDLELKYQFDYLF